MTFFRVFTKALVSNFQNDFAPWKQVNGVLQVHYAKSLRKFRQMEEMFAVHSLYTRRVVQVVGRI
jgi:hypothetical protein